MGFCHFCPVAALQAGAPRGCAGWVPLRQRAQGRVHGGSTECHRGGSMARLVPFCLCFACPSAPSRFRVSGILEFNRYSFCFFALLVAPFELFSPRTFQSFSSPKAFLEPGLSSIRPMPEDYCCLGNHEFDYGGERLRELMSLSRFPWLGSNVREARRGKVGRWVGVGPRRVRGGGGVKDRGPLLDRRVWAPCDFCGLPMSKNGDVGPRSFRCDCSKKIGGTQVKEAVTISRECFGCSDGKQFNGRESTTQA